MNKIIKFGATIIFTFFLVACNKGDPAADYQKLVEWSANNQQSQLAFQQEYEQKLATGDIKQIEEAMNALSVRNAEVQKSLDSLDINSKEINELKDKMKFVLSLSSELAKDGLKLITNPTEETQRLVEEKTQKATEATLELQKLQAEYAEKYGKKRNN